MLTSRCYITSQNHGYHVQTSSLNNEWESWFENINDKTNEGIYHTSKPIRSVQFHPEADPGPNDTLFLMDGFINTVLTCKTAEKTNHLIFRFVESVLI